MEALFRLHKPRLQDYQPPESFHFKQCVRDGIVLLKKLSKRPYKTIEYIRRFLIKYPIIALYGVFIALIRNILPRISYYDNVMVHSLTNALPYSLPLPTEQKKGKVIGIIPDGNRRWAKEHSHSPSYGHFIGACRIADLIRWSIIDSRVSHLVVYLLSYDNYTKRSEKEQSAIRDILQGWVSEFTYLNNSKKADIAILGEPDDTFREAIGSIPVNPRKRNPSLTRISLLLCYEGRREIQSARGNPKKLWLQEDLDVVIRTGFTQRSSGFCTYQTAYSEWFYPGIYWPEMSIGVFNHLLEDSYKVKQNYGV